MYIVHCVKNLWAPFFEHLVFIEFGTFSSLRELTAMARERHVQMARQTPSVILPIRGGELSKRQGLLFARWSTGRSVQNLIS